MPLLSYALANVADVKESLGIDAGDSSKNNLIIRKINQATEMIEGYCQLPRDHHFAATTYTNEEYDGSSTNQLSMRMRPVTALTAFQSRGTTQNISDWDDIESQDYFLDSNAGIIDMIFNQGGQFNRYRLSYTAGYTTIPSDLSEACVMLASYLVDNSSSGVALKRKQEGQREIEYFQPNQTDSLIESLGIDDMLGRYMNYAIAEDR